MKDDIAKLRKETLEECEKEKCTPAEMFSKNSEIRMSDTRASNLRTSSLEVPLLQENENLPETSENMATLELVPFSDIEAPASTVFSLIIVNMPN